MKRRENGKYKSSKELKSKECINIREKDKEMMNDLREKRATNRNYGMYAI
jgi:hypothetical protein